VCHQRILPERLAVGPSVQCFARPPQTHVEHAWQKDKKLQIKLKIIVRKITRNSPKTSYTEKYAQIIRLRKLWTAKQQSNGSEQGREKPFQHFQRVGGRDHHQEEGPKS
jgi:hypothetical protein